MGDPVVFFEITGPDGTALQSFYSEVFGWAVESRPFPGYAYISTDQAGVQAGGIREEPQAPPERVLYIRVPDLQAAVDRVVAHGGTVLIPPTEVPGIITFALFKDPAGNTTGLVKA